MLVHIHSISFLPYRNTHIMTVFTRTKMVALSCLTSFLCKEKGRWGSTCHCPENLFDKHPSRHNLSEKISTWLEQIKGFQNLPWKINQKQKFESLFFRISNGSYFLVNLNFPWRYPPFEEKGFFWIHPSRTSPKNSSCLTCWRRGTIPVPTQESSVKVPLPGDSKWPFYSPSWRSRNLSKRSLNHPKKVTQNCQVLIFEKKT